MIGNRQGVHETGTHSLDIEGWTAMNAQTTLQQAGRAGEYLVGRRGSHDDQIDVRMSNTGSIDRLQGGLLGKVESELPLGRDMTLPDTGTLRYPGISRINCLFQFRIGDDPLRQIATGSNDTSKVCHVLGTDGPCTIIGRGRGDGSLTAVAQRKKSGGVQCLAQTVSNHGWQVVSDFQQRNVDGIGERNGIGTTVALDYNPLQTQQTGSVVLAGVDPITK